MPRSAAQQKQQAETEARVVEMHARGMTFPQIAAAGIPGCSSKQQAHKVWKRALAKLPKVKVEEYRQAENVKLDNIERRLNTILLDQSADVKDVIRSAQTMINAMKRRADLNGLDVQPSDAPNGGINTVLVDLGVLTKTRSEADVEV